MLVVVGLDVAYLYIHVASWPARCISHSCNVNYRLQLVGHESRTGSIRNRLKLVATTHTTVCNRLRVVAVAVAQVCRILKTGLGLVAPKKAKNTGPDWTLEYYLKVFIVSYYMQVLIQGHSFLEVLHDLLDVAPKLHMHTNVLLFYIKGLLSPPVMDSPSMVGYRYSWYHSYR